jgi:hypothetical protein
MSTQFPQLPTFLASPLGAPYEIHIRCSHYWNQFFNRLTRSPRSTESSKWKRLGIATSVSPTFTNERCGLILSCLTFVAVAACGVPKANAQHAVVMCRFARNIMVKFRWVCRSLELTLGPDTGGKARMKCLKTHYRFDSVIGISSVCC